MNWEELEGMRSFGWMGMIISTLRKIVGERSQLEATAMRVYWLVRMDCIE